MMHAGIDVGGTFTDSVVFDGRTGEFRLDKRLTTPADPCRAVLEAGTALVDDGGSALGALEQVLHATTLVTNALIERKGAPTALITTEGYRDTLEIGRDVRFDLFDLNIDRPEPLVPRFRRLEVRERIREDGSILVPLEKLGERIATYRNALKRAKPIGKFVNNRLAAYTLVHCAETNAKAIENGGMRACHWWYQHLAEVTLKWEAPIMKAQVEASGDVTAIGGVQARLADMEKQARGEVDVGEYDRQNMVVVGDPDTILRKLESYEDIDVDNLICLMQFGGLKHPDILKSIELMGKYVIPELAKREKKPAAV